MLKMNFTSKRENEGRKTLKTMGKATIVTALVLAINSTTAYAGVGDAAAKGGNDIGYEVWKVIKMGSMWIMAGFAVKDILESLNEGDHRAIGKIMFKYGLAFAAIAFMIKYFMWIDKLSQK